MPTISSRSQPKSDARKRTPSLTLRVTVLLGLTFSFSNTLIAEERTKDWTVILIGGVDSDPTPQQRDGTALRHEGNSGLYRLRGDLLQDGFSAEYFNWNGTRAGEIKTPQAPGTRAIAEFVQQRAAQDPAPHFAVVGNSWGGHTAWELCDKLGALDQPVTIDHAVFLDASSAGRAKTVRPPKLPENVHSAAHFFTRNVIGWRHWPSEPRLENIDLGDPAQGFLKKPGPAYDSAFDVQAHIAAEWDESIHTEIRKRLKEKRQDEAP